MSARDDGGPAFPKITHIVPESWSGGGCQAGDVLSTDGMSMRDYFAAHLAPHLAGTPEQRAEFAYRVADALLKERTK